MQQEAARQLAALAQENAKSAANGINDRIAALNPGTRGQPLRKIKGMMRSAVCALDLTADALAAGKPVPEKAVALMAKPGFPRVAYRFMANWGWRSQLKKEAGGTPLDARPFA